MYRYDGWCPCGKTDLVKARRWRAELMDGNYDVMPVQAAVETAEVSNLDILDGNPEE